MVKIAKKYRNSSHSSTRPLRLTQQEQGTGAGAPQTPGEQLGTPGLLRSGMFTAAGSPSALPHRSPPQGNGCPGPGVGPGGGQDRNTPGHPPAGKPGHSWYFSWKPSSSSSPTCSGSRKEQNVVDQGLPVAASPAHST